MTDGSQTKPTPDVEKRCVAMKTFVIINFQIYPVIKLCVELPRTEIYNISTEEGKQGQLTPLIVMAPTTAGAMKPVNEPQQFAIPISKPAYFGAMSIKLGPALGDWRPYNPTPRLRRINAVIGLVA